MINKQIINFILIGITNVIINYSLYSLFIFIGLNYILASLFSTIISILFNFQTFKRFVFKTKNNSLINFIGVYVVVYLTNIFFIYIFYLFGFDYYISGFLALFPCAIVSFVLNKFYVFRD
jgi:putative flippase GtrA